MGWHDLCNFVFSVLKEEEKMKARLVVSRPMCACGNPDCRLPRFKAILDRARQLPSSFRTDARPQARRVLTAA